MSQWKVLLVVMMVMFVGEKAEVRGEDHKEVFENWRELLVNIWKTTMDNNAFMEFKPCTATEEQTRSRAYLERLFKEHGSTGVMAHAWPRMTFYNKHITGLNLQEVKSFTQCMLYAWYDDKPERLVCSNGTCAQCFDIPKSSPILWEACHLEAAPTEVQDPSRIIEVEKEEEPPQMDDCGWLDIEKAKSISKKGDAGGVKGSWSKCDASAGLVMGRRYLRNYDGREGFRGFFEHKLRFVKGWEAYDKATFCTFENDERLSGPKIIKGGSYRYVTYFNLDPLVCGPDGICVECRDVKKEATLLYEACNPEEPAENVECRKATTTTTAEPNHSMRAEGQKVMVVLVALAAMFFV